MHNHALQTVLAELAAGIDLPKCRQCGCMAGTLENLAAVLPTVGTAEATALAGKLAGYHREMQPVQYACLGCAHCYPAVAQYAFGQAYPALSGAVADLSCAFEEQNQSWPPVVGEYFLIDQNAPVAVSTLASVDLAAELARANPAGLAIVGKTETENIGVDKVIKNIITNPALRYLLVTGAESAGHVTGKTFLALAENGVDQHGRVIGSPGKRPVLRNVTGPEIEAFRRQVQVVDLIGCTAAPEISAQITALAAQATPSCACDTCAPPSPVSFSAPPTIIATEPGHSVTMDPAGYFVITPRAGRGVINVEHYAYDHTLLHVMEGPSARAIYKTLVDRGWVTTLSHAAYLGHELAQAEHALHHGVNFMQDGA